MKNIISKIRKSISTIEQMDENAEPENDLQSYVLEVENLISLVKKLINQK